MNRAQKQNLWFPSFLLLIAIVFLAGTFVSGIRIVRGMNTHTHFSPMWVVTLGLCFVALGYMTRQAQKAWDHWSTLGEDADLDWP